MDLQVFVLLLYVHGVLGVGEAAVVHEAEEGEESAAGRLPEHDAVGLQHSCTRNKDGRRGVGKTA
jgi:hypothetical protein